MRLENEPSGQGQAGWTSVPPTGGASTDVAALAAREQANRWLARFAPLLEPRNAPQNAESARWRIRTVRELRAEAASVRTLLEAHAGPEDAALLTTLRSAVPQLDVLESEFRRALARFAPGDPEGLVDLDALREDLAEAAARRELGPGVTAGRQTASLSLTTSHANWATGGFLGIFSLGWLAFTTFHASMMIGGMMMAFGPPALFLLLFYGIFWAVGVGMAKGALDALATETLDLTGHTLTIRKKGVFGTKERSYTLGPQTTAEVLSTWRGGHRTHRVGSFPVQVGHNGGNWQQEIALRAADGREVRFARNALPGERERFAHQINTYLQGLG